MDRNELIKFWDKIRLNSCYYPLVSDKFMFYDPKISKKITEEGVEIIKKLNEKN